MGSGGRAGPEQIGAEGAELNGETRRTGSRVEVSVARNVPLHPPSTKPALSEVEGLGTTRAVIPSGARSAKSPHLETAWRGDWCGRYSRGRDVAVRKASSSPGAFTVTGDPL